MYSKIFLFLFLLSFSSNRLQSGERLKVDIQIFGQSISIMEGGNFSIDIRHNPFPLKSQAMQDYLTNEIPGISPCQGAYFGNQNQTISDRDAAMVEISGLKVYGVDAKQDTIIAGVEPIGIGMDATLKKLQEILLLSPSQRPIFIGFDVDDTLLGLRMDRTKEEFLKDRRDLAEAIVQLAMEGVKIVFFSDGDSQVTLNRIGYPLMQILQEKKLQKSMTLTFYVNGMITKLKLATYPDTEPTVAIDADYGTECHLKANCVALLSNLIGGVAENINGLMLGSGILADYYFDHLTRLSADGLRMRNQDFFPEFMTIQSLKGNVLPPTFDLRNFNSNTGDVTMMSITGLPSAYRPILIHDIAAQLKDCGPQAISN
jgi:hypothetical protein